MNWNSPSRLELANTGSNEHGMVMINYDVQNHGSEDVKVEARMLLDSAVGDQDFVYYEIPNTSYDSDIIKRECVLDAANIRLRFMHTMTFTVRRQRHQP